MTKNTQNNRGNNNGNRKNNNNGNRGQKNKNNGNSNRGQNNKNNNWNTSNSVNNGRNPKNSGRNPNYGKTCDNCLEPNHTSNDCHQPCGNCGGTDGHKRKKCRNQVQNGNGSGAALAGHARNSNGTSQYCKYCNRLNHASENCTNAHTKQQFESSHTTCTECNLQGHDGDTCANSQLQAVASHTISASGPKPMSAVMSDNDSWFQHQHYNKLLQLVDPQKALVCERCVLHQVPTDRSNHMTESCHIYSYCVYCNICDMPFHNTHTCPNNQSKKAYEQSQLYCYGCGHKGHVYIQESVIVCKHPNPGEDVVEIGVPMSVITLHDKQVQICGEAANKAESPNPTHNRMLDRLHNRNCHYLAVPRMAELAGKDFRLHCGSCDLEAMVVCSDQDIVMGDCDQHVSSVVPLKAADMCLEIGCDHWGYLPNDSALVWKKPVEQ